VAIDRRKTLPWRRLTGDGRTRPSGPHFGRDQALEDAHDTRNPSGWLAQVCGGCNGSRHGMGGSGQRSSPACARSRPRVAYDLRRLALKVRGEDVMLTKARDRLERGGVVTSTADRRRRWLGFVERAATEGLWAPGHRGSTRGGPAKVLRELIGPAVHRRQAIAAAAVLTCGDLRGKFRPKNGPGVASERR
jgi:hypothetical protein